MTDEDTITIAHGAGSKKMRSYLEDHVVSRFNGRQTSSTTVGLQAMDDGAVHEIGTKSVVITTDSHVISPLFFPGGDIGQLAIAGTVNDLAVMGATTPLSITCSLIIEEGTAVETIDAVLDSMKQTCDEVGCTVTTGDTKVMGSGEIDTLAINTTAIGDIDKGGHISDASQSPGDKIIVSGTVGDHGIALLAEREGIDISGNLTSDIAPVNEVVDAALQAGKITAMTDPTRGGLGTALNEMAQKADVGASIDKEAIPVDDAVASAGELLGIDPLYVANEGKVVFCVDEPDADRVLSAIRDTEAGRNAAIIGEITDQRQGSVILDTGFGKRYMTEPQGQQLPRIC